MLSGEPLHVFQSAQLATGFLFIESRNYLDDASYDGFTDAVFRELSKNVTGDMHDLMQTLGGYILDGGGIAPGGSAPAAFQIAFANSLMHAFRTEHAAHHRAFKGTANALAKTTHLYCAMTFGDAPLVQDLGA